MPIALGTNIAANAPYNQVQVWNDLKNSFEAFGQFGSGWNPDPNPISADGYPLGNASAVWYALNAPTGLYTLQWSGSATVAFQQVNNVIPWTSMNTVNGVTTATINLATPSTTQNGLIYQLSVSNVSQSNPFTNFHMYAPGTSASAPTFSSAYINYIDKITTPGAPLRLMDWSGSNTAAGGSWTTPTLDRIVQPSDFTQTGNIGVAAKYMGDLSVQANRPLWISIPYGATNNYVTQLADALRDSTPAGQPIYIQNSNEMIWNPGFAQYHENYNDAQSKYPSVSDPGLKSVYNFVDTLQNYYNIFSAEFAKSGRAAEVKPILDGQEANTYWLNQELTYAQQTGFLSHVDSVSVAAYYGNDLENTNSVAVTKAQEIAGIQHFLSGPEATMLNASIAVSAKYGKKLRLYEGGFGDISSSFDANTPMLMELQSDPELYTLQTQWLNDLNTISQNSNGAILSEDLYTDFGTWTNSGSWGQSQTINISDPKAAADAAFVTVAVVPEPTGILPLVGGILLMRRRRRRTSCRQT